jgi:hypothetical protein
MELSTTMNAAEAAITAGDVRDRLAAVEAELALAARDSGRAASEIELIAVSKTVGVSGIEAAIAAGQRVFGENYVKEAQEKWPALLARDPELRLHMIGPLQSNKADAAVRLFDAIHSLDRPSLAGALAKEVRKQGRQPRLFVQVNTGNEPQKSGVAAGDAARFVEECRAVYGLKIEGLMCIPPFDQSPSPHFALLAKLAKELALPYLSMGMSADFVAAIQLGATHVRIGTAIFGERRKTG